MRHADGLWCHDDVSVPLVIQRPLETNFDTEQYHKKGTEMRSEDRDNIDDIFYPDEDSGGATAYKWDKEAETSEKQNWEDMPMVIKVIAAGIFATFLAGVGVIIFMLFVALIMWIAGWAF